MRKALVLLLLCLLLPAAALAMPYEPSLSLSWQRLTDSQKAVFTVLYEAAAGGKEDMLFDTPADYDDVTAALRVLETDFPELCGLEGSWSVSYYRDKPEQATGVSLTYAYTGQQEKSAELLRKAQALLTDMPEGTVDRELRIYDIVRENATYVETGTLSHEAAGALLEGKAVCEGYAEAMVLLCRLSGIPCSVVTGMATSGGSTENHAWVLLQLDGVYTQADPTWDDSGDIKLYDYFNVSDAMISSTHQRDADGLLLPACESEALNWHTLTGNLAPSGSGFRDFLYQKKEELESSGVLRLRFAGDQDRQTAIDYFSRTASFTWYSADGQPCITIFAN